MATKVGYNADVYMAAPASVAFTVEATTDAGDHKTYTITNATKRYWDRTVTYLVEKSTNGGASWSPVVSGFTLQFVGGKVIFAVANGASDLIRVSGSYLPITQIGQAAEWTLDLNSDAFDVSAFGSGWKAWLDGPPNSATAKLKRWWLDGYFATTSHLTDLIVLVLYVDSGPGTRYEAFAYLKQDSIKTAVNAAVEEDLTLEITGQVFYVP